MPLGPVGDPLGAEIETFDRDRVGAELHGLAAELFPICRSLTGDGVRRTLARIAEVIDLHVHEVPTGTQAFDWVVPREWNVTDAYVADVHGNRIIDFRRHNLHLVNYSAPVQGRVSRRELDAHLHSLVTHPDWVPYRTSYYT